jgi:hypothetical protein
MYIAKTPKRIPLPNNPKKIEKKTITKVKPNLSLGIIWQGPNLSWLVRAYAADRIVEAKDNLKIMSKSIVSPL